jgi:hypothetical protein
MNNISNNNTQDFFIELVRLRGNKPNLTIEELFILIKGDEIEYKAFGISKQAAIATAKRVFKLGSVLPLPSGGEGLTPPPFNEETDSAIFERGYSGGSVSFANPVLQIANNVVFNDSPDISKISDSKIRLEGGYKYKIEAFINCTSINVNSFTNFQIFNASDTQFIGVQGTVILTDNTGNSGSLIHPVAYINQSTAVEFEVQFSGGDDVTGYNAVIVIEKVSSAISSQELFSKLELSELLNTYASVGYTQKQSNGTNIPLVINGITGTGNEDLTPPDNPQPMTGGDYKGFIKIAQFEEIDASESMTVVNGEIIIGQDGDYYTSHAWLDISCTANGNNIGFIFGIERAGQYIFSQRPTGMRASNGQDRTNISGGGFLATLESGDKLSVWVASEKDANITIYDANLGLNLRSKT